MPKYIQFTNSEPNRGEVMAPIHENDGIDKHIPIRWKKTDKGFVLETLFHDLWVEVPVIIPPGER